MSRPSVPWSDERPRDRAEAASTRAPRRTGRWIVPVLGMAGAIAFATWLSGRPATVTASSTFPRYTLVYLAENLLDGSPRTVWMPASGQVWADIRLRGARSLRRVSVTNGDNPPHFDQSTRDFRVELFLGDTRVHAASGRFPAISTETRTFEVGGARADRIRVSIDSWHARGGCLADVSWEEEP